jgi:nucleoside-diphosphate-sugar epimerase
MEYALKAGDITSFNFGPTQDEVTVEEVTEIICKELSQKIQVVFRNNESSLEAKTLRIDSSNAERNLNWKNQISVLEAVTSTARWWESVLNQHLSAKEACINEIHQILETRFRIKSPEAESIEK